MTDEPAGRPVRGFSTRAILAATRSPTGEQHPPAGAASPATPPAAAGPAAVAELEGAESGCAFGSGMAAIHAALAALVRAGDRIVATRAVYGSTRSLPVPVFATCCGGGN